MISKKTALKTVEWALYVFFTLAFFFTWQIRKEFIVGPIPAIIHFGLFWLLFTLVSKVRSKTADESSEAPGREEIKLGDGLLHKDHASENKSGLLSKRHLQLFINGILIFAVFILANFFMVAFDSNHGGWAHKRFDEVETLFITTSATVLIVFLYTKIAKKFNL